MSSILEKEKRHLAEVLKLVRLERDNLRRNLQNLEKRYAERIKAAADAGRQDDAIEEISAANELMIEGDFVFKKQFLERLESQSGNPYFARIDFHPDNFEEPLVIYIGKHAFLPKEIKYRISDWRSPAASVYYNYTTPVKRASYEFMTPVKGRPWIMERRKVIGELKLRRNIEISEGKILGIYDNNLRIDLLTSELSKKSGGQLDDIVKTIQSEQDEIIRSNPNRICVVQGTAGSGKTTVAIHRISYLFYTYKDYLKEENTLLLSSSKVLVNYVAKTLPELEIYSLTRDTLPNFLRKVLKENGFGIDESTVLHIKGGESSKKNSREFIKCLDMYISDKKNAVMNDLMRYKSSEVLQIDRYLKRQSGMAPYKIVENMLQNFIEYKSDLEAERKHGNITVEKKIIELVLVINKFKLWLKRFNPVNEYKTFLKSGYLTENFRDIKFFPKRLDIDDICIVYYLAHFLRGVSPQEKNYKHVVVDEGQDLGLLNYAVIKTFTDTNGFTILGDLNQATENSGQISSWDDLKNIWDEDHIDYFNIKVSYRTTKEIIKLARKILSHFPKFTYLPEPFDRSGEEPVKKIFSDRQSLLRFLLDSINKIRAAGDDRAIGVIEPNIDELQKTSDFLNNAGIEHFTVDENFDSFDKSGVYLVSEKLVKGLEFNTVFVLDPNEKLFPLLPTSAKRLFVMCTRAINNLFILSISEENELFK